MYFLKLHIDPSTRSFKDNIVERFSVFQLSVVVLWPAILPFWFSVTALTDLLSAKKLWLTYGTVPAQHQTSDRHS